MTKENIVDIIIQYQVPYIIDLLIIDMDGNDYWVLKSIIDSGRIKPRVICVEYQDIIGPNHALTIPYDPNFNYHEYDCWEGVNTGVIIPRTTGIKFPRSL